ncbi:hypothetical protein [Roseiconus lacunae]|uniref:hypothetical protein n=1 Tax=Roseiconus lacunae TaxID=2605694 RepID=UPI0011F3D494|nr:hypothetical protein [Roseiconus lacunae]
MIGQVEQGVDALVKVTDGRSEIFVAGVLLFVGAILAVFFSWKFRTDAIEREDRRETERQKMEKERSAKEEQRMQSMIDHANSMAARNADQLDVLCGAMDRTSRCMESMAKTSANMETAVLELSEQQRKDRSAIGSIIDATELAHRGESDRFQDAIRDARTALQSSN